MVFRKKKKRTSDHTLQHPGLQTCTIQKHPPLVADATRPFTGIREIFTKVGLGLQSNHLRTSANCIISWVAELQARSEYDSLGRQPLATAWPSEGLPGRDKLAALCSSRI